MRKVRVGVIGVGRMGRHHARAYAHFNYLCDFVGVYDVDPAASAAVAEKFEVQAFERVEDLLGQVEAITIATPTCFTLTWPCRPSSGTCMSWWRSLCAAR